MSNSKFEIIIFNDGKNKKDSFAAYTNKLQKVCGFGPTEEEAIDDFIDKFDNHVEELECNLSQLDSGDYWISYHK